MEFQGQQYKVIMKLTSKEFQRWYRSLKELDEIMQMRASKVDITFSVQGCSGTGNEVSKLRESEKPEEVVTVPPFEEQIDEMEKEIPVECVVGRIEDQIVEVEKIPPQERVQQGTEEQSVSLAFVVQETEKCRESRANSRARDNCRSVALLIGPRQGYVTTTLCRRC